MKNIHTPVLFVLGESDFRTPQDSGGEQLFRALKYMKRPTAMVVFPRETHELSRSGEPWHRIERLEYIVGWFDKWMMGVPHPEFDIIPGQAAAAAGPKLLLVLGFPQRTSRQRPQLASSKIES